MSIKMAKFINKTDSIYSLARDSTKKGIILLTKVDSY